jgi:hypothetical protein
VLPTSHMLVWAVRALQIANHPRIRVRGKEGCMYVCMCMYVLYVCIYVVYIYVCMCMCGGKRVVMTQQHPVNRSNML